jgi:RNA polymerase sigma factor (sigma-70 family)
MKDSVRDGLAEVVRHAQAGSGNAILELCERFRNPLRAIIHNALPAALRRLYDEEEFLNDTVFIISTKRFPKRVLRSPKKLWSYIIRIAEHTIHAARAYLERACRDIHREAPLGEVDDALSRELGPEEAAMVHELAENIHAALVERQSGKDRDIARLWLSERCNGLEISRRLGLNRNTVQRTLTSLKKKLRAIVSPDK